MEPKDHPEHLSLAPWYHSMGKKKRKEKEKKNDEAFHFGKGNTLSVDYWDLSQLHPEKYGYSR